jgi:hypothetical protein
MNVFEIEICLLFLLFFKIEAIIEKSLDFRSFHPLNMSCLSPSTFCERLLYFGMNYMYDL